MKSSLRGAPLPESLEDFNKLKAEGWLQFPKCYACAKDFEGRTRTTAGWKETQISGLCEDCWDGLFADEDKDK